MTILSDSKYPGIFMLILLLTAGSVFTGCSEPEEENERPDTRSVEIRPDVIFVTTDDQPLHRYLESTGVVEPERELVIQSRIGGFIAWHQIKDGQRVAAGDTLFRLVEDEWQLRLMEAENAYLRAQQEYRIERELRNRNIRSGEGELSEQDDRILRQQTGYLQAQIAFDRAKLDLSYTAFTAPYAGVIHTTQNISSGSYLNAGAELGRLLDHRRVLVRLDVLEPELTRIREGMQVELQTPSGLETRGIVRNVSPMVNRERKTGQILVAVDNRDGVLKTGMTVDGRIHIETHEGRIRAPRGVLVTRDGRSLVFRLKGETVEWVYVEPAVITPDFVLLNESALSPGDTLAYDRHFALSHQQRVNVRILN